jgi:hypothetical protein
MILLFIGVVFNGYLQLNCLFFILNRFVAFDPDELKWFNHK